MKSKKSALLIAAGIGVGCLCSSMVYIIILLRVIMETGKSGAL